MLKNIILNKIEDDDYENIFLMFLVMKLKQ
jgi:hypothetical protein